RSRGLVEFWKSPDSGEPKVLAAQLLPELVNKKNCKLPEQAMVSSLLTACVQHGDFETAAGV
ncbi:hypothetical protein AK812_SmicGene47689, partial [Symbiodinium microadriaticum]